MGSFFSVQVWKVGNRTRKPTYTSRMFDLSTDALSYAKDITQYGVFKWQENMGEYGGYEWLQPRDIQNIKVIMHK